MSAAAQSVGSLFKPLPEVQQEISETRQFNLVYALMLVMGCLIALLGLLVNSPAVIIGAMLISPLMGPILSCGLALTVADLALGRKALRNAVLSVAEVVIIATLATWISPLKEPTAEILARTSPNLMDLLIAFFSGVAGTVALCGRKGGLTIIPGVAIATAVMPPLATVGYGLATRQWSMAGGAAMLFFTNFMAIMISANAVFLLVGFRPPRHHLKDGGIFLRHRVLWAWLVVLVLSVPLFRTLSSAAQQLRLRKQVESALREHVERTGRSSLASWDVRRQNGRVSVNAYVRTVQPMEANELSAVQTALAAATSSVVDLNLQQVQVERVGEKKKVQPDFVAAAVVQPPPQTKPESALEALQKALEEIAGNVQVLLGGAGAQRVQVEGVHWGADGIVVVEVSGSAPRLLHSDAVDVAAAALARHIGGAVRLIVRMDIGEPVTVTYPQRVVRPAVSELRKARASLAPVLNTPGVTVAAGGHSGNLFPRRIALLSKELKAELQAREMEGLSENQLQLSVTQAIEAPTSAAGKQPGTVPPSSGAAAPQQTAPPADLVKPSGTPQQ